MIYVISLDQNTEDSYAGSIITNTRGGVRRLFMLSMVLVLLCCHLFPVESGEKKRDTYAIDIGKPDVSLLTEDSLNKHTTTAKKIYNNTSSQAYKDSLYFSITIDTQHTSGISKTPDRGVNLDSLRAELVLERNTDSLDSVRDSTLHLTRIDSAAQNTQPKSMESQPWDLQLDVSLGTTQTRFMVQKPTTISTNGKSDFLYTMGIVLPLKDRYFVRMNLRLMRLRFEFMQFSELIAINQKSSIRTEETMNFLSLPCDFGIKFQIGKAIPYIFGQVGASYLTAGNELIIEEHTATFPDGTEMKIAGPIKDINTTQHDLRYRMQWFAGFGMGLEMYYGYGTLYIESSILQALLAVDKPNDALTKPIRIKTSLLYIPVCIGVRFYI